MNAPRYRDARVGGCTDAVLETRAQQRGQALGSGFAYPVTLERVAAWAADVERRGYQLAPASALTARR